MMRSNLTNWIEDADARAVLLEGAMIHQFQENAPRQHIHLGPAMKTVASWWHHSIAEHLLSHKRASTYDH